MSQQTATLGSWSDEVEDQMNDMAEQVDMPPINELLEEVVDVDDQPATSTSTKANQDQRDLTPKANTFTFKISEPEPSSSSVPLRAASRSASYDDTEDYQESFASQQEAAEIRQQISSLDERLTSMTAIMEAILAERSHLPKHIDHLKIEMNRQMTLMSDKINHALESNIPRSAVEEAKNDIETLSGESTHVLGQLSSDTSNHPDSGSQTARREPITKTKRKVRVVE